MRLFQVVRRLKVFAGHESGITLIETLVALAIVSTVAVSFLGGLSTSSEAAFIADERTTAESLARSQIEWAKKVEYVYGTTEYSPAPMPGGGDYSRYSVIITAESLQVPDDGIQKITVTIKYSEKVVIRLEGYKVNR
jgi:type II secretory pathway pseudopilin PulG